MTPNPKKTVERDLLKEVVKEAVAEVLRGACICGLNPEDHRRFHEKMSVSADVAAANHQFIKDLRETVTSALKKIVISLVVGVVLLLMGWGAKAWFRGG